MPILNGVEFLKKMQYLKLQEYPRIIVISGMISKLLEVQNNKNVYVVVTADLLKEDVISKRGKKNLIFSSNGVDYSFFQKYNK